MNSCQVRINKFPNLWLDHDCKEFQLVSTFIAEQFCECLYVINKNVQCFTVLLCLFLTYKFNTYDYTPYKIKSLTRSLFVLQKF